MHFVRTSGNLYKYVVLCTICNMYKVLVQGDTCSRVCTMNIQVPMYVPTGMYLYDEMSVHDRLVLICRLVQDRPTCR